MPRARTRRAPLQRITSRDALFAYFRGHEKGADLTVRSPRVLCVLRPAAASPRQLATRHSNTTLHCHAASLARMRFPHAETIPMDQPPSQPSILNLLGRMTKAGFPDHDSASFVADPDGGADRMDCALAASYLYYK